MSEKIKVVPSEPVTEETVAIEKPKRNWKAIATGVAVGAISVVAAGVLWNKFGGNDDDDFESETVWSPMPDLPENNQ